MVSAQYFINEAPGLDMRNQSVIWKLFDWCYQYELQGDLNEIEKPIKLKKTT